MEKQTKHYVVEVRGEGGLERTLYVTGTSAREVRERIVARGYRVVKIRLDRRAREEIERGRKTRLYEYTARSADGKVITGTSEAESEAVLVRRLREKGYFVRKVESRYGGAEEREPMSEEERRERLRDAIQRIVAVILERAIKDRANTIRIEPGKEGVEGHGPRSMFVQYRIGEAWHEIMSVPIYVWQPLRERFAELAGLELRDEGEQTGPLQFEMEGKNYTARVKMSPGQVWVEMPVEEAAPVEGTGADGMTEALSRLDRRAE
jgi:type II secretory ATPase GspE/PulE/Tfp pilus assembly ATPase PilB-like protein